MGVGQSEVDIVKNVDTTLMVMVPGLGDDIQVIKAGVMEIGDIFAVNKADRDGAKRTITEIEMMLDYNHLDWRPPVQKVIAVNNQYIDELLNHIKAHKNYLNETGKLQEKRKNNCKSEIIDLVYQNIIRMTIDTTTKEKMMDRLAEDVVLKNTDVYSASEVVLKALKIYK